VIKSFSDWDKEIGIELPLPSVMGKHKPQVLTIDLNVNDNNLKDISIQRLLALSLLR